jgi:hypothetical protein
LAWCHIHSRQIVAQVVLGDEDAAANPQETKLAAPTLAADGVDRDIQLDRNLVVSKSARQKGDGHELLALASSFARCSATHVCERPR